MITSCALCYCYHCLRVGTTQAMQYVHVCTIPLIALHTVQCTMYVLLLLTSSYFSALCECYHFMHCLPMNDTHTNSTL